MVSFEIFVKAMPPSLSESKVLPSFCFAFKIPYDRAASIGYGVQHPRVQSVTFIQVVTWHEHPISQEHQLKRPQFVQNRGQWELIWDNLTGKHRQQLLQFQRLKWTMAISDNFPNCNTGLLLSFFGLELPQEVGEGILEPTVISLSLFLNDSGVESFKYIHRSQTL